MKKKAVFLDRDGVINATVDRGDNCIVKGKKVSHTAPWTLAEFKVLDGVPQALEALGTAGFIRVVVTNQPDVTYGMMTPVEYEKIMAEVRTLPVDDIYACTHGRDDGCTCKKPKPGMLLTAADKWNIDLSASYMVGDSSSDLEAGRAAGCRTIFVSPSSNTLTDPTLADYTVTSLPEAVQTLAQ